MTFLYGCSRPCSDHELQFTLVAFSVAPSGHSKGVELDSSTFAVAHIGSIGLCWQWQRCNMITGWLFLCDIIHKSCSVPLYGTRRRWLLCDHVQQNKLQIFLNAFYETPSYGNYLTLILQTWRIWWTPNNVSKWQMGFNSVFKGLRWYNELFGWTTKESCFYSGLGQEIYILHKTFRPTVRPN